MTKPLTGTRIDQLKASHAILGQLMHRLTPISPQADIEALRDTLWALYEAVRDHAPPRNPTGCLQHPHGAVDLDPPEGWGRCLLCNTNRHRAATTPGIVPLHVKEVRAQIRRYKESA